ncbi:MAG: glycosyltransferase family 4 protein [Patescibacteria group bacterium]
MSKVLLTTLDFPPQQGGVARYLWALKQTFQDEVDVLYWRKTPSKWEMWRDLTSGSAGYESIWVSHILPVGTMAYLAKFVTQKPYVIFLHGMDFDLARRNRWKKFLTRRILKGARRVVTNSQALAYEVQSFVNIIEPMVVHPCVVDYFVGASQATPLVADKTKVTLLTVSRLVERKGHIQVLEAIRNLPNVHYTIVGDGPYYGQIYFRIKDLGLEHRVRIIRNASDEELPRIYQSADIFVMPTIKTEIDREGFGIVYLEAQLFKLPVIASNHPGVNEAVLDKVSGFLIEEDIDTLREVIERLVNDSETRKRMGAVGRDFVLAGFTRDKQFPKLRELL